MNAEDGDRPLRILILEDNEVDALLAIGKIKRGGFSPTFERVQTAPEMKAALEEKIWDIILADYALPEFSAFGGLRVLQEVGLDLPFLVISGAVGEETAVTVMKAGAHDFIMKSNLARLVPAVERELRDAEVRAERRRAEAELRSTYRELEKRVQERTRELEEEIAERKAAEEALIRSERLAAVGTLAGGVAHEFNNINVTVIGFAQLALQMPDLSDELRDWLERIHRASRRAASITKNLLAFSSSGHVSIVSANIADSVRDAVELVRHEFETEGLLLVEEFSPVPDTMMDREQIAQVILNLLINARHALLECPRKEIRIEVGSAGKEAYARVADTGCGIAREDIAKIFTPFYSTKGEHARGVTPQSKVKGAGLGLSVSHRIISDHGGRIEVSSAPGEGSALTVFLPVVSQGDHSGGGAEHSLALSSGARVLVLDDEQDPRDLLRQTLERLGCRVHACSDGEDALARLREGGFAAALIDLQMPGLDGMEVLRQAGEIPQDQRPALVVVTGRPCGKDSFEGLPVDAVLKKPFDLEDLACMLAAGAPG